MLGEEWGYHILSVHNEAFIVHLTVTVVLKEQKIMLNLYMREQKDLEKLRMLRKLELIFKSFILGA